MDGQGADLRRRQAHPVERRISAGCADPPQSSATLTFGTIVSCQESFLSHLNRQCDFLPSVDSSFFRVEVHANHSYWRATRLEFFIVVAVDDLAYGSVRRLVQFELEDIDRLFRFDISVYAALILADKLLQSALLAGVEGVADAFADEYAEEHHPE